ncbi:MAG: GHKL domain-containing protein [Aerococcus sp.]|nr:GHKL domain-containing protein [Aerococcus sp.]
MNYFNFDKRVLATKELSKSIIFANVILLFLNGLRVISSLLIANKNSFFVTFDTTVALVIFVGYLLTISHLHERQLHWLHQEQIKQKEQENRDLNVMVTNLGDLYDQIRAFRHDFGNIIGSLGPAIETGTREEINDVYEQVLLETNTVLRKADYSSFNLKHIEDIAFRNVLAQKMVQAKNADIPFYLECRQTIPKVEVPMLETIRLLSILLDNAMEEAIFADEPRISVAITHLDATTTFSVQNTRQRGTIDQRKIWEAGYSTKGENRGLGLATVLDIQKQFPNIEIETAITAETFTQTLIFYQKGDSDA